ncbi:polysaccharide pyruvyl transferase family protein [Sphingomonas radiodurans]|uniref:polysaccharide pyruvyl transferase family protein n=1 Tax=Sphingomonas radiodurans TaxID=2890321 RepID=UPI001E485D6A|nr:polysaccharide pyruvyl transferase family protein [Sphingomonas radiodurans]WBH17103.1 polysaccharide pyruvyl transferase family protein [Sphingomonas radiodurans]
MNRSFRVKVAILNVKYSPNLGDGLLAECLERELVRHHPSIEVVPIDLAGRTHYGGHGRNRALAMRTLERLPGPLRRVAAWSVLSLLARVRLRPAFRAALADCDAAVIGGGNLFADDDLNFPIKLALGLAETRRRDVPVAVFAVGVSDNWSATGERLFARALASARLACVRVRDERSQDIWNRRLGVHGVPHAKIARDPGLLAARCYALPACAHAMRVVALCVTDPLAVRYHGGSDGSDAVLAAWYTQSIAALADAEWDVALFTNGSPEDRAFLDQRCAGWVAAGRGRVRRLPDFAQPADLVAALSRATIVIAHRMHACIAAYSCGVPAIGLRWDRKLDSFFALSGRDAFMVDTATLAPAEIVTLAERAAHEGVEPALHADLLDAASASVALLGDLLRDRACAR